MISPNFAKNSILSIKANEDSIKEHNKKTKSTKTVIKRQIVEEAFDDF